MQVVFFLLKPLIFILARSPFWLLYFWSDLAYLLFYKVLRYRVKVVRKNLGMVFPTYLIPELKTIERKFYRHFFDLIFEGIKYSQLSEKDLKKRCHILNPELFDSFYAKGKNAIIVMGHSGNWEWASSAVNIQIQHQVQALFQPIENIAVNDFVLKTRERFGSILIERKQALRHLIGQKNNSEHFVTAFIADQSPYQMPQASWVNFFGIETPFFNGYAAIAQKLDMPIIFSHVRKVKRGFYEIENVVLTENPKDIGQEEIVKQFAKRLEKEILNQPFNWLWTHKRWKRAHLKPSNNL